MAHVKAYTADKIHRFRDEAARALDLAAEARDGEMRVSLLHIARVYERLADKLEALSKPTSFPAADPRAPPSRQRSS